MIYDKASADLMYQPKRAIVQLQNGIHIDLGLAPAKLGAGVWAAIYAACYHLELINRRINDS